MIAASPISYDPSTDSMYVRFSQADAHDQEVQDERDLVIDRDAAGNLVGYDIQHASNHLDVIAEAFAILRTGKPQASLPPRFSNEQ